MLKKPPNVAPKPKNQRVKPLDELKKEYEKISKTLSNPEVISDPAKLQRYSKQYTQLQNTISIYEQIQSIDKQISDLKNIQDNDDPHMQELTKQEEESLLSQKNDLLAQVEQSEDTTSQISEVIVEIRAGVGGEESSLFAQDLMRMYMRFADKKGFKYHILEEHTSELKGIKDVALEVSGDAVYSLLKNESGVHRVQRIPETEKNGRIHTSTASVAVLPKAQSIDITIRPEDIKFEAFRASGPGGQNVNKVSTAIRVVHLPTGMSVASQQGRSQAANRETALTLLRSRLLKQKIDEEESKRKIERKEQIGTSQRSEKIRTYNFPQNRVTDHRVEKSWYNLEKILDGGLDDIVSYIHNETHNT